MYAADDISLAIRGRTTIRERVFCRLYHWPRNRTFPLLKNTVGSTLRLLGVENREGKEHTFLIVEGFELIRTCDQMGILEYIEFVDHDFLNKIFYVLAFLILII